MVYGFVKQSGGHIKVYSEVGHGTTISIYLPRAGERTPTALRRSSAGPAGNETILVVEDDDLVRAYVVAQLGSLGYTTLSAATPPRRLPSSTTGRPSTSCSPTSSCRAG